MITPQPPPAHPLIDRLMMLVDQLRRRGIDVTTGSVIDAVAGLTHLPLDEPAAVKAGLRATLVKSSDPTGEFDRAFRAAFAGLDATAVESPADDEATGQPAPIAPTPGPPHSSWQRRASARSHDVTGAVRPVANALNSFDTHDGTSERSV